MKNDDVIRVRVNKKIKEDAVEVLSRIGLTTSDAVRLLLLKVVNEGRLPFDINSSRKVDE